jgi:hypothetical protein
MLDNTEKIPVHPTVTKLVSHLCAGVNADRSDIRRKRWDGEGEDELDSSETTPDDHVITKRQSQSPVARNIHAATASTPSQDLERIVSEFLSGKFMATMIT